MYIINLIANITTALTLTTDVTRMMNAMAQAVAGDAARYFGITTGIFETLKTHDASVETKAQDDGFTVRITTKYFDDLSHYGQNDLERAFTELQSGGDFTTFLQDSEIIWESADELSDMIHCTAKNITPYIQETDEIAPEDVWIETKVKSVEVNTAENKYDTEITIQIEGEIEG